MSTTILLPPYELFTDVFVPLECPHRQREPTPDVPEQIQVVVILQVLFSGSWTCRHRREDDQDQELQPSPPGQKQDTGFISQSLTLFS